MFRLNVCGPAAERRAGELLIHRPTRSQKIRAGPAPDSEFDRSEFFLGGIEDYGERVVGDGPIRGAVLGDGDRCQSGQSAPNYRSEGPESLEKYRFLHRPPRLLMPRL